MRLGNTLFIHIPRTGGTHFEKLLGFEGHNSPPRCGSANYPVNHEEIMGWDRKLGVMLQHATYSEMIKHDLYSPKEKLITVSIVRDPYQRTVSLFKYYGGDIEILIFYCKIYYSNLIFQGVIPDNTINFDIFQKKLIFF